jgi:hypothetical protein
VTALRLLRILLLASLLQAVVGVLKNNPAGPWDDENLHDLRGTL